MAKSLSERIAERVKAKKPSKIGKNRAAFLAVRDDVKQALDDGWPVKTIWETLHEEGKITFNYDAFIGYVNRLIRCGKQNQAAASPLAPAAADQRKGSNDQIAKGPPVKKPAPPPNIGGFKFESIPKKEDLL